MIKKLVNKYIKSLDVLIRGSLQDRIYRAFESAFRAKQVSFPEAVVLPRKCGKGLPERVVELLLARLSYKPGFRVLDVAHANAMPCHLKMINSLPQADCLVGIDIAEPVYDASAYYNESYIGDITKTSFPNNSFDLIFCISALEHFGMDNSGYTENFTVVEKMDKIALKEMVRILKPGGSLLVTVPYGKYEDNGWFRNYDKDSWQYLLKTVRGETEIKELYFMHTSNDGWITSTPEDLKSTSYYNQKNSGAAGLAAVYITKSISQN